MVSLSFLSELTLIIVFSDTTTRAVPCLPTPFLRLDEGNGENICVIAINEGQGYFLLPDGSNDTLINHIQGKEEEHAYPNRNVCML